MIQHTEYDKKLGKYIKTMVPQSKEHKERIGSINKAISKYKEPNHLEYQKKFSRAYND